MGFRSCPHSLIIAVVPLLISAVSAAYNVQYNVSLTQYKESSTLGNMLTLVQEVSPLVTLDASAGFTAVRSKDLDRFTDTRSGSASLSFRPIDTVELSANLSRTIDVKERYGELISDQLQNTATGGIRCYPSDWLDLIVSLGTHFEEYRTVSGDSLISGDDRGGVTNISVSVNHGLTDRISTSVTFNENRTLGRQTDRNQDDISGRISYSFPGLFEGGSAMAQVGASRQQVVYHDSSYSNNLHRYYSSFSITAPTFIPSLSLELTTNWSWEDKFWESDEDTTTTQDARDRLEQDRGLSGRLLWQLMEDLSLEFSLSRSFTRRDRKQISVGLPDLFDVWEEGDNRSFVVTVDYWIGDALITFDRLIELYSYDTYGVWEDIFGNPLQDNYDRDELRESMSLRADVPVNSRLSLEALLQAQRQETIYIYGEQSGNNKVSSTYSISPSAEYDLGNDWTIDQTLDFSADYTTYTYPDYSSTGANLLFRRVESVLSVRQIASDSTQLGFTNRFRYQDNGTYESSVYNRSEERISNQVTLYGGFHIRSDLGITPTYSFEYSKRILLGSAGLVSIDNLHHVGISCRMKLGGGDLSLNTTRTFYADDRPSYWTATASFDYLF